MATVLELANINMKVTHMASRKTPEEKLADLQRQRDQINARIQQQQAKLRGQQRKEDTRRKIIAGALALEHMAYDAAFAHAMQKLIADHVTRPEDRKLFDL